jgi:hypothetical protein
MAKPKLALIPAAQGSDLYSVLPSSGVGDFDFTRSGSATRINSQGLIESVGSGVSRLNYPMIDGVVKGCPHHILEPQRTNLFPYSEDFSVSNWSKYGQGTGVAPTLTSNYAISPDGTLNASRLQFNKGSGTSNGDMSILNDNITVSSGATTSKSVYVKSNTSEEYDIVVYGAADASGTNIKKVRVTSEWQRVDVYKTVSSTTSGITIGLREISVTGLSDTADVLVWGAQLEIGSYPTSYIPTNGTAVTRSAETANGSGDAATFNDSEGVLMAEVSALVNNGESRRISISHSAADTSNRVTLEVDETTDTIKAFMSSGNVTVGSITVNDINQTNNNKIALLYKEDTFEMHINGFLLGSDYTISSLPIELSRLQLEGANGSNDFYGNTKQLQYYNSALTDSEIEQLTSWTSFTDMAEGQLYTIE